MTKIKKILSVVVATLVLPVLTFAAVTVPEPTGQIAGFGALFDKILKLIWPIVAGLAAVMIVVAGILFIAANGDPEKIKTARTAILWAIIGIVVAILAYSIPKIVGLAVGG